MPKEVGAEFAFAEVVRSNVAVDGAGDDLCGANVKSAYTIFCLVEGLNWGARLGSEIPKANGRVERAAG